MLDIYSKLSKNIIHYQEDESFQIHLLLYTLILYGVVIWALNY